jgi:hypothetical protein
MSEEFLHGADIVAVFEQVGGETVAEGVRADRLDDARQAGRLLDRFLQTALAQVVAARDAAARVFREALGGEDALPAPLLVGIGVLAGQGIG